MLFLFTNIFAIRSHCWQMKRKRKKIRWNGKISIRNEKDLSIGHGNGTVTVNDVNAPNDEWQCFGNTLKEVQRVAKDCEMNLPGATQLSIYINGIEDADENSYALQHNKFISERNGIQKENLIREIYFFDALIVWIVENVCCQTGAEAHSSTHEQTKNAFTITFIQGIVDVLRTYFLPAFRHMHALILLTHHRASCEPFHLYVNFFYAWIFSWNKK